MAVETPTFDLVEAAAEPDSAATPTPFDPLVVSKPAVVEESAGSSAEFVDLPRRQLRQTVAAPVVVQTASPRFNTSATSKDFEKIQRAQMLMARIKAPAQQRVAMRSSAQHRGSFVLSTSQRNATALFGAGLIDSISDKALEAAAARKFKDFPEITGRVSRLPDGKIGRFGWKSQKAALYDFTMTACAVELGLNVPGQPQSGTPMNADYRPAGFDLEKKEVQALTDFIRELPAPTERKPTSDAEAKYLSDGKSLFSSSGCAACHTEKLGDVAGIYGDLLLHDLGPDLGDTGDYGVFIPDSPGGDANGPVPPLAQLKNPHSGIQHAHAHDHSVPQANPTTLGAERLEWRTAPLWGVRDSAPYLHDGRAGTLEEAIAFHGGEASKSAQKYFMLDAKDRMKVQAFLKSLTAPTDVAAR